MTDDSRFHVKVEYSPHGVRVTGLRLAETACSQTITPPKWIYRKFGRTFEGEVRAAVGRTQRICDKLNKQLSEAREVCKAVEELPD